MKQAMTLTQLAEELERQASVKRDFVGETTNMAMIRRDSSPALAVETDGGKIELDVEQHAHRQIGSRLGIPAKYYDRMLEEAPDLLVDNVNHWFHERPEVRMVRSLDGRARAFLSRKYRPIDNDEVASTILPVLNDVAGSSGIEIASCNVTSKRMYIKALFPRIESEVTKGDVVRAGVVISNSEVGAGALRVETLVYRLVCLNGMIAPDRSMRKSHVGRALGSDGEEVSELFRDETVRADNRAFVMKLQDVVRASADQARFESIVDQMREASEREIEGDPSKAVEVVQKRFALTDDERGGVLRHLATGGSLTQWGMVNAVTRHSQDVEDYDRATELEELGGKILDLDGSQWRDIAAAA